MVKTILFVRILYLMQKYKYNLIKSLLSEEFITQARLFMRFHLTKSSTALLVFAAPPTAASYRADILQIDSPL